MPDVVATCAFYVAQGKTCARPVGHDKDPTSLHWHPDVEPTSRCDYRGDCLKDAGHRSTHLYLPRGTSALAGVLRRAVEEGTARVVYTREPGRLEHWWLQVDRTRVSRDERDLLDSFVPPREDQDPMDRLVRDGVNSEPAHNLRDPACTSRPRGTATDLSAMCPVCSAAGGA